MVYVDEVLPFESPPEDSKKSTEDQGPSRPHKNSNDNQARAIKMVGNCTGLDKGLKTWIVDNHLLVFLFFGFVIGLSVPQPGVSLSKPEFALGDIGSMRVVQVLNVVLIFLIAGFRLKTDAMIKAVKQPAALIYGMILILLVTPCVGFVAVRIPFESKEFAHGLALFCCVPTTLTSGAALVSGCKGANRATELALMITVSTNLVGCFTTPMVLGLVLSGSEVSIDIGYLLIKLMLCLLIPTLIGKLAQTFIPGAAKFSKTHKTPLTIFSNFNLVMIVWQSVSRSQRTIASTSASQLFACIACGVFLHIVFWVVNFGVFFAPGVSDIHYRRSVFLLASQKTLPVSMAIISGLPESSVGQAGLVALPCIFGHLSQLVIDSFLVDYWARHPCTAVSESE